MSDTKMVLRIDRGRWRRGKGSIGSMLRDHEGRMCCLGFLGCQLGYEPDLLEGNATPADVLEEPGQQNLWPAELLTIDALSAPSREAAGKPLMVVNSDFGNQLMAANDVMLDEVSRAFTDSFDREARLTELFADIGIRVVFE